jgi:hypothetical protein
MKFTIGGDTVPFYLTEEGSVIVSNNIEELFDDIFRVKLCSTFINVEKVGKLYTTVDDVFVNGTNIGKKTFTLIKSDVLEEGVWINEQDVYSENHSINEDVVPDDSIELFEYKQQLENYKSDTLKKIEEERSKVQHWYNKFSDETKTIKEDMERKFYELVNEEFQTYLNNAQKLVEEYSKENKEDISNQLNESFNSFKDEVTKYVSEYSKHIASLNKEAKNDYKRALVESVGALNKKFKIRAESVADGIEENLRGTIDEVKTELQNQIKFISESVDRIDYITPADFVEYKTSLNTIVEKWGKVIDSKQTKKESSKLLKEQQKEISGVRAAIELLESKLGTITEQYDEKLNLTKNDLFDKIESSLNSQQTETIVNIQEKVKDGKDVSKDLQNFKDNFLKEVKTYIGRYIETYGIGSGSVAVQYANGGTINGTLDVTNRILSGGRDLAEIFTTASASGYQTLTYDTNTGDLTIAPFGNTVSLASLSGGGSGGPESDPKFTTWAQTFSANYQGTYTTVQTNSAAWGSGAGDPLVNSLVRAESADWNSVYSNVQANSALWGYQGTDIKALTGNWQNTWSVVQANSGTWAIDTDDALVNSLVRAESADWNSVYSNVQANSGTWNYQGTDIRALTGNWQNTWTSYSSQSANNSSVYSTVQSNSALWGTDSGDALVNSLVRSKSGDWNSTYTTVQSNSANWTQTLTFDSNTAILSISNGNTVSLSALSGGGSGGPETDPIFTTWAQTYSADYSSTYTTVQTNSASWGTGGSPQSLSFNESNAELTISLGNTISLSALSGGGSGGLSIQGNIAYNRWQFVGQPPISSFALTGSTQSDTEEAFRVTIDAVIQDSINYTISGDYITFSEVPPLSSNIVVIETYVALDESPLAVHQYQRWAYTGNNSTSAYNISGAMLSDPFAYRVTVDYLLQDPLSYTIDISQSQLVFSEAPPLSSEIVIIEQYHTALTAVVSTFTTPVTASGDFLIVRVNNVDRAIRLWDF